MTDANLLAWAVTMGFDPARDYVEPDLPVGYLSPHFREAEFRCNHCGTLPMEVPKSLLQVLEEVRAHFGDKPLVVTSGYRCKVHNRNVGGAQNSTHLRAQAADVWIGGVKPIDIYRFLDPIHKGGLGHYETFTHIDVRLQRARWGNTGRERAPVERDFVDELVTQAKGEP